MEDTDRQIYLMMRRKNECIVNCDVNDGELECYDGDRIRDGVKKSKWKFKMAFAMKGGGSRGGLECHLPILKNDFF